MFTNYRFRFYAVSLFALFCLCHMQTIVQANEGTKIEKHKLEAILKNYLLFKKRFSDVTDIDPDKAQALLASGQAVFIDVREKEEQAVSMIKNAWTVDHFLKNFTVTKGKTIVVYCTIGYRSGILATQLARHGIHVQNLAGGLLAWVLSGGNVYDATGETRRIHVYGRKWQFIPEGYEAVMFE